MKYNVWIYKTALELAAKKGDTNLLMILLEARDKNK